MALDLSILPQANSHKQCGPQVAQQSDRHRWYMWQYATSRGEWPYFRAYPQGNPKIILAFCIAWCNLYLWSQPSNLPSYPFTPPPSTWPHRCNPSSSCPNSTIVGARINLTFIQAVLYSSICGPHPDCIHRSANTAIYKISILTWTRFKHLKVLWPNKKICLSALFLAVSHHKWLSVH